jgi:hypothetical protein
MALKIAEGILLALVFVGIAELAITLLFALMDRRSNQALGRLQVKQAADLAKQNAEEQASLAWRPQTKAEAAEVERANRPHRSGDPCCLCLKCSDGRADRYFLQLAASHRAYRRQEC